MIIYFALMDNTVNAEAHKAPTNLRFAPDKFQNAENALKNANIEQKPAGVSIFMT
jgi:hypothetical protein